MQRRWNHVVFLEVRRDFRVTTGISGFLLGWPWESQSSPLVRGKAGGCARVTAGPKRPHLGVCPGPNIPLQGRQGSRGCIPGSPGESGLVLSEEGNSACLSNCSGCLMHLVELCVETAGFSGRLTGVSVPLRVVPSPTGLLSKRCPGIGFLSRADWEIGVVRHVAPPMGLVSNFLGRPASS